MRRYTEAQILRLGAITLVVALLVMAAAFNLSKFPGLRGGTYQAEFTDASGLHPGMSSLISIFDFTGDEPSLVYLENDANIEEVTSHDGVDAYGVIFGRIREAALDAQATTAYLDQLADTLE